MFSCSTILFFHHQSSRRFVLAPLPATSSSSSFKSPLHRLSFLLKKANKSPSSSLLYQSWTGLATVKFCFNVANLLGGVADKSIEIDQQVSAIVDTLWMKKVMKQTKNPLHQLKLEDVKFFLQQEQNETEWYVRNFRNFNLENTSRASSIFNSSRSAELITNCLWRSLQFHRDLFFFTSSSSDQNNINNNHHYFSRNRKQQLYMMRTFLNVIGQRVIDENTNSLSSFSSSNSPPQQQLLAWEDLYNISFVITRAVSLLPSPEGEIFDKQSISFVNNLLNFCKIIIVDESSAALKQQQSKSRNKNILTLKYPGVFNILTMIYKKSKLENDHDAERAKAKLKARQNVILLIEKAIEVMVTNSKKCVLEPLNKKQMSQIVLALSYMNVSSAELLSAFSPLIFTLEPKRGYQIDQRNDQEQSSSSSSSSLENSTSKLKQQNYKSSSPSTILNKNNKNQLILTEKFHIYLPTLEVVFVTFVLASAGKFPFNPYNEYDATSRRRTKMHSEYVDVFFREKVSALTRMIATKMHITYQKKKKEKLDKKNNKNNNDNQENNITSPSSNSLKRESFFALNPKSEDINVAFQFVQLFLKYHHSAEIQQQVFKNRKTGAPTISNSILFSDKTFIQIFKLCSECLIPVLQPGANWLDLRDVVRVAMLGREFLNENYFSFYPTPTRVSSNVVVKKKEKDEVKKEESSNNKKHEFVQALEHLEARIRGKIHLGLKRVHYETVRRSTEFEAKVKQEISDLQNRKRQYLESKRMRNQEEDNHEQRQQNNEGGKEIQVTIRNTACFPFARSYEVDSKMLCHVAPFVVKWICLQQNHEVAYYDNTLQETIELFVNQIQRMEKNTNNKNTENNTKRCILNMIHEMISIANHAPVKKRQHLLCDYVFDTFLNYESSVIQVLSRKEEKQLRFLMKSSSSNKNSGDNDEHVVSSSTSNSSTVLMENNNDNQVSSEQQQEQEALDESYMDII